MIPFSSLRSDQQQRVWALADSICMRDCLPLVKYFGNGAPVWYDNVSKAVREVAPDHRIAMVSGYWHQMQKVPFIAAFVLEGESK